MIENTASYIFSSTNYLVKNQEINSLAYQNNGQVIHQETFQVLTDQVNITYNSESISTYNQSMALETHTEDSYDLLRGLVVNIFKEQGLDSTIVTDVSEVDVGTLSPDKAQELIADDGYFGAEKTSDRIFNFAVGLAGGDPARVNVIREGVENGFNEALDAFGGWLPEISYDTYNTVMKKIDDWAGVNDSPQYQA